MMVLRKVISGGQTGVDQGGLAAALKLGIQIGGWAPKGYRCETGRIKSKYSRYLRETDSSSYPDRTEKNVISSDATIIYCPCITESKGTSLTIDLCKKHKKLWFDMITETSMFYDDDEGYDYFSSLLYEFRVINIAGPRESSIPGIFESSRDRLIEIFKRLIGQ